MFLEATFNFIHLQLGALFFLQLTKLDVARWPAIAIQFKPQTEYTPKNCKKQCILTLTCNTLVHLSWCLDCICTSLMIYFCFLNITSWHRILYFNHTGNDLRDKRRVLPRLSTFACLVLQPDVFGLVRMFFTCLLFGVGCFWAIMTKLVQFEVLGTTWDEAFLALPQASLARSSVFSSVTL